MPDSDPGPESLSSEAPSTESRKSLLERPVTYHSESPDRWVQNTFFDMTQKSWDPAQEMRTYDQA